MEATSDYMLGATLRELGNVAEALIFSADEPVQAARIAAVFANVTGEDPPATNLVVEAIEGLNAGYLQRDSALRIEHWAEGYRMATVPAMAPYLHAFFDRTRKRKLSRSLLETISILAYRQPVTKPEIDFVRGVDADYALRRLMEMGLVDVVGRSESVGRPLLYGTTPAFLDLFGLASLEGLPNLREVEELLNDPAFNREKARLLLQRGLDPVSEQPLQPTTTGLTDGISPPHSLPKAAETPSDSSLDIENQEPLDG